MAQGEIIRMGHVESMTVPARDGAACSMTTLAGGIPFLLHDALVCLFPLCCM